MCKSKQRKQHCNWKLAKIPGLLEYLSVYNCSIFCQILFLSLHFLSLLFAAICWYLPKSADMCYLLRCAAICCYPLFAAICNIWYLLLSACICWYLLVSAAISARFCPALFSIFHFQCSSFQLSSFNFLFYLKTRVQTNNVWSVPSLFLKSLV